MRRLRPLAGASHGFCGGGGDFERPRRLAKKNEKMTIKEEADCEIAPTGK